MDEAEDRFRKLYEPDEYVDAFKGRERELGIGFYIACYKQPMRDGLVLWWGSDNRGYTTDLEQAGIYLEPIAGYHDNGENVPVPVAMVENLRVRRIVDTGDSLNTMLWNAQKLRASLTATGAK